MQKRGSKYTEVKESLEERGEEFKQGECQKETKNGVTRGESRCFGKRGLACKTKFVPVNKKFTMLQAVRRAAERTYNQ